MVAVCMSTLECWAEEVNACLILDFRDWERGGIMVVSALWRGID